MSKLSDLSAAGTAVWLDFVDRKFLEAKGLEKLVNEDGLTGVTSNPSIFEKAMGHGDAYDATLAAFDKANPGAATIDRYEHLAIQDIKAAAETLQPVYDRLDGKDGYVSLEVSPYIADDTDATIAEAEKLWHAVGHKNLMIKIPGTVAGAPAISATIAKGINVNVTLLFALDAYIRVAEAYATGLEERVRQGQPIDHIASVASFFVSRIDTVIDKEIDRRVAEGDPEAETLKGLRGKVAIANRQDGLSVVPRLREVGPLAGARRQGRAAAAAAVGVDRREGQGVSGHALRRHADRPRHGQHHAAATMDAFRERGTVAETLTQDVDGARKVLADAERLGLNLTGVTDTLVLEGVASFAKAFDDLLGSIAAKQPAEA